MIHGNPVNFTYDRERELIVFTTRRDTRKCENLIINPRVAILLHDFPHLRADLSAAGPGSGTFSITLYGTARVLAEQDADSKILRDKHLDHNPDQAIFIEGPGIAVVAIEVEYARICDDRDRVTNWSIRDGWGGHSPPSKPSR